MKAPLGVSAAALLLALTSTLIVAEEAQTQDRSLLFGRTKASGASGASSDDGIDAIALSKKLSPSSLSVLYGEVPESVYQQENLVCPVNYVDNPASLQDFVVRYKAVGKSKEGQPACQIDAALVASDFVPLEDAAFLGHLEQSIAKTLKKNVLADYEVQICGLQQVQNGIACPKTTSKDWAKRARDNAKAAKQGKSLPWPGLFENKNYRGLYEVLATVKGNSVATYADTVWLAKKLETKVNERLAAKYGAHWACKYRVDVQLSSSGFPLESRTLVYDTTLVATTLQPDGYDAPGNYYTDAEGVPQWLGPTVTSYKGDLVKFRIANDGDLNQLTHFHGMLFDGGYNFNDGSIALSSGTQEPGTAYTYTFKANPAGTSFYHGHAMYCQGAGNRGMHIVRKTPCNDPYAGYYDDEIVLALDASLPWFLNTTGATPQALRHVTAQEDWSNFNDTTCNYCYPANANVDPDAPNANSITLSYGGEPLSDQPWAGPLINGQGRAIPLDYSSDLNSATSTSWGAPAGSYFSVNVDQGKTYRLRVLNAAIEWGFRFWIEDHDMTIISISGGDVEPIFIPTKPPGQPFNQNGIELSPAERYDVLVTANYNDDRKGKGLAEKTSFIIHVDSLDGCYKGVGFLLYDDATMTPALTAQGDAVVRNRLCDEDCYENPDECNILKQFASDLNHTQIFSIEPEGVPPPNLLQKNVNVDIVEGFTMNGEKTPVFMPPLYVQHFLANNSLAGMHDAAYLAQYSFDVDEVVDWCLINYSADRHPMHLHAKRFWMLSYGVGDATDCLNDKSYQEGTPVFWGDTINMIPPPVDGQPDDPGVMPSYLKIRSRISQVGPWAIHCHLEYHMALGLIIPVLVGVDQSWPVYPADLPLGPYMDF